MEQTMKFQGDDYLLIGSMEKGGAIATKEQYENGQCSYAHLMPDGAVIRFCQVIGHRDEIEVTGECEVDIRCSVFGMLGNWPGTLNA